MSSENIELNITYKTDQKINFMDNSLAVRAGKEKNVSTNDLII